MELAGSSMNLNFGEGEPGHAKSKIPALIKF